MTRTRIALSTALATMLGAALPAMAQAPVPAPMYAPAPAPAPMMAPAPMPMPEAMPVMPAAPMVAAAPRAADDMTGSVGFGVGVGAGTSLIVPDDTRVMMKYWVSDTLAIQPWLNIAIGKAKGADAEWLLNPGVLALFNLLKGASTRFDAGVGLGFVAGKQRDATTGALPADATIGLTIPVALNVEHFFTRWFSMGLGTGFNLLSFDKTGDAWSMRIELSNLSYMGSLFFYTD
jgi:hypothetical protein